MKKVGEFLGHAGEITGICGELNDISTSCLASSSVDGTIRLWDQNTMKCTTAFISPRRSAVNCVKSVGPYLIGACDDGVLVYDARKGDTPLPIVRSGFQEFPQSPFTDSIYGLDINTSADKLGICDDSGTISICDLYPLISCQPFQYVNLKQLESTHGNISSCVKFGGLNSLEILSGGFDCNLLSHSVATLKRTDGVSFDQSETQGQVVNPPFIYSIDNTRTKIGVALGNGCVGLLRKGKKAGKISTWKYECYDWHAYVVSQVKFVGELIFSCSLDGTIYCFDDLRKEKKEVFSIRTEIPTAQILCMSPASGPGLLALGTTVQNKIYVIDYES